MAQEIERRFLVKEGFDPSLIAFQTIQITQSYLPNTGEWTVRARHECWRTKDCNSDEIHYTLTLKKFVSGATNVEIETEIEEKEYQDLFSQTNIRLTKTRYVIIHEGSVTRNKWEVDVYSHNPEFQTIAEIELLTENATFDIPDWIDKEVTGDRSYSNAALAERLTQT